MFAVPRIILFTLLSVSFLFYSATSAYAVNFDNTKGFDLSRVTYGQELGCLAMNIYHEGRGESAEGRAAIASVTMNRKRSPNYPDTVCEVVWQDQQFSWTKIAPRHHVINDAEAWHHALVVAELFMNGAVSAKVGDATHYHTLAVQPSWRDMSKAVAMVGNHVFYSM